MKKNNVTEVYAPAFLGLVMTQLTDRLVKEGSLATEQFRISAPVRAFSTLLTLRQADSSVTEIASQLGMTHAGVIKNIRALEEQGLVSRRVDQRDSRRKPLVLTKKGQAEAERIEKFTQVAQQAYRQIFDEIDMDISAGISRMHRALDDMPFDQRLIKLYAE